MLLATLRRRFTLAIISMLFLTMFLPLNILPGTAFAQTKPGQCPQGKLCRLSTASLPTPAQGTYINVVPTSGPPNTSVAATGGGFPANDTIQIWFDQTDTGARATTDSQGNFKTNFNVPSNATLGIHPVYALDGSEQASTPFQVTSTSSALSIQTMFTRDGNGNVKNTFAPGDAIQYVVYVNNSSGNSITTTFHFQAYGPNNNYIFDSTFSGVSVPQGLSGWYTPGTVPNNAPAGAYTMRVHVEDQNNSQNQDTKEGGKFTVTTNTPTVTVQKVWTGDGNNNARTSFLPGDAIHYLVQVKNSGSKTVTTTFTFVATGPQKIFSWSGPVSVPTGTTNYYSPSTVPSNAPAGSYTLKVTVTYNGVSSSGKSQFTVGIIAKLPNWAGYGAYSGDSTSGIYSDIQADWQEPAAICPPSGEFYRAAAFWVGMGGNSAPLEQIATQFSCDPTGQATYHAAYQMVPKSGGGIEHIIRKEACRDGDTACSTKVYATVKANDQIHADITYTGSNGVFQLYIHDKTQKWYFSIKISGNGSGTGAARSTAECIAEDPKSSLGVLSPLANFGTIFFTNCLADGQPIGNRGPVTIEYVMQHSDGTPKAVPSQLNSNYKAFSVMWENE